MGCGISGVIGWFSPVCQIGVCVGEYVFTKSCGTTFPL